jgi:hypothetical protein
MSYNDFFPHKYTFHIHTLFFEHALSMIKTIALVTDRKRFWRGGKDEME